MELTHQARRPGLEKFLGPLEAQVMEAVWALGPCTVRQVYERLGRQRERPLAYTTVMTTMVRLTGKGLLQRHRRGAAYVYVSRYSRDQFIREAVRSILEGLMADFPEETYQVLAHLSV